MGHLQLPCVAVLQTYQIVQFSRHVFGGEVQKGFFQVVSPEAFISLLKAFPALAQTSVPLHDAAGRVLASDVTAAEDLPMVNRSCMDGYAVNARDAFGASESNPAYLECRGSLSIDEQPSAPLSRGDCVGIVTGGTLPEGADAVVMVEHTQELGAGTIEFRKSVAPGDNVMQRGEDARAGQPALTAGTPLRPQEVGLLAALGVSEVPVRKRPRVGLISTGDELIPVTDTPRPGQIRDVNSYALGALVRTAGGVPTLYGLVRDDEASLAAAIKQGVEENDVVLISGGSSIGVRDLTQAAIEELPDAQVLAHGVAVSPGKPTILARAGSTAVWGLPGQVTSAQVVMHVFGLPFLRHIAGDGDAFAPRRRSVRRATLGRNIASKQGREDYVRVRLETREDGACIATPVLGKSGLLRTMLRADGLVRIPADTEGLFEGHPVDVWLLN
jgi:molybdopterin molybdotransferase